MCIGMYAHSELLLKIVDAGVTGAMKISGENESSL